MGRPPCCDKVGVKKGPWTPEEDIILVSYIQEHGPGNWRSVPTNTGLLRCSKSCRLRWTNYLRPGIKRGNFTPQEEGMIIHLQALLGNKWAAIASYLPQRTDNDIKNYWNTHLKKKLKRFQSDSSTTTSSTQFLSKSNSTATNTTSTSPFHFTSSTNAPNNHTASSTYASSTENISRLLEGWMRSSPKPTTNTNSLGCYRPKAEQVDQGIDHGGGGELMSHEEFESILSFENLNNVSWDKSSSTNCEEKDKILKVSEDQKKQKSDQNTNPPPPPLSFLEKWLLDENSTTVQGEEALELSSIF